MDWESWSGGDIGCESGMGCEMLIGCDIGIGWDSCIGCDMWMGCDSGEGCCDSCSGSGGVCEDKWTGCSVGRWRGSGWEGSFFCSSGGC